MKFFIPLAKDAEQAERAYEAVAKFVHGAVTKDRIWKLSWRHKGMDMVAEVGKTLHPYYQTGQEVVIAIIDCGTCYSVCTANRGVARGEPIRAGKGYDTYTTYFDEE